MKSLCATNQLRGLRSLSGRETQLILLAAGGLSDKEIAKELGISVGTVTTLWSRLRAKQGIGSRILAVAAMASSVARMTTQITSLDQELRSPEGIESHVRLLVSRRQIVLSCSTRAWAAFGLYPGCSLAAWEAGGRILELAGLPARDPYLPRNRALVACPESFNTTIDIPHEGSVRSYRLEYRAWDDPDLGWVFLLDFSPELRGNFAPALADVVPLHAN